MMKYKINLFDSAKIGSKIIGHYYEYPVSGTVQGKRQMWRGNGHPTITELDIIPDNVVMGESTIRTGLLVHEGNFEITELTTNIREVINGCINKKEATTNG